MLFKVMKKSGKYLYFTTMFLLFFSVPVHAYIDPSVATYAIQAIAGIAITLGAVFGVYWRRIVRWFRGERIQAESRKRTVTAAEESIRAEYPVQEESEQYSFKETILDSIPAVFLMLALSFMLGYYAPMEIYVHNQAEFWFDYSIIRPVFIYLTVSVFLLGFLILAVSYFIHKKCYKAMLSAALSIFLILYFEGTVLSGSLPVLDGSSLELSGHAREILESLALCFGVSFIVAVAARIKKKKLFYRIIIVLSVVFTGIMFVSLNGMIRDTNGRQNKEYKVITKANEFTFSTDTNVIILMMDSVNGEMAQHVLEDEEYSSFMEDFTFFPDTLGGYSYTSRSIPLILTGQWYENEEDFESYYKKAMNASPLFTALKEKDYRLNVYEKSPFYVDDYAQFDNFMLSKPRIKGRAPIMALETKMVLFKYLPFFFKSYFTVNTEEFEKYEDIGSDIYFWYMDTFYRHVRDYEFTLTEEKQFKYYHFEGAYAPYDLSEDVLRLEGEEGTYEGDVRASFETAHQLIMRLKKLGIYDNSIIVFLSDHGINQEGGEEGRQNPALLIKGLNEHHSLEVSDSPVSYGDLQNAFVKLIAGKKSDELFTGNAVRRFLHYSKDDPDTLTEYTLEGNAQDWENLVKSGKVFQTGGEKQ